MKRWSFRVAASTLGLTFVVCGIELALRLAAPPWLRLRMSDLRAGEFQELGTDSGWPIREENGRFLSFTPSSRFTISHYEYRHTADVDELGGRAVPDATPGPELVPFVGDSFVFGIGVSDSETFVNLLARGAPLRYLNLGLPGTSLNRQLDIVERRHAELGSPETCVFVLFLGNDLTELRDTVGSSQAAEVPPPSPAVSALARLNAFVYHNPMLKRAYVIQFVRQKLLSIFDRGRRTGMDPVFRVLQPDSAFLIEATGLYRLELLRLERLSSELRFTPLFVIVPDRHQINERLLALRAEYYGLDHDALDVNAPNDALSKIFEELSIEYVDTTECLEAAERENDIFYLQDNHLNSRGHTALANCLRQRGFLSRLDALLPLEPDKSAIARNPIAH